ncbi:MAG TPA: hypothetical protein VNO70_15765 [Blastocatellia bacterium]|nr:hypothetical protein [Blastocatellia bacterium]
MNPEEMTPEELQEYMEWQEQQYAASADNTDDDPIENDWRVIGGYVR